MGLLEKICLVKKIYKGIWREDLKDEMFLDAYRFEQNSNSI